jgi:hypothetical protein
MKQKKCLTILCLAMVASCLSACTLWNFRPSDGEKLYFGGTYTDESEAGDYFTKNGQHHNDGSYTIYSAEEISASIEYQPSTKVFTADWLSFEEYTSTTIEWIFDIDFKFGQSLKNTPFSSKYMRFDNADKTYEVDCTYTISLFEACPKLGTSKYKSNVVLNTSQPFAGASVDSIANQLYDYAKTLLEKDSSILNNINTSFTFW